MSVLQRVQLETQLDVKLESAEQWHTVAVGLFITMTTVEMVGDSSFAEIVAGAFGVLLAVALGAAGYQLSAARRLGRKSRR